MLARAHPDRKIPTTLYLRYEKKALDYLPPGGKSLLQNLSDRPFQLVSGGELFDRIVKLHHFSEHDAAVCVQAVLQAVAYLHGQNICHRDIKPENILLRSTDPSKLDEIVIADFGVARHMSEPMEASKTLVGSPGYSAPELICEESYRGPPADIWSIGVITYAMLAGSAPFRQDQGPDDLLREQLDGNISFEKEVWKTVSQEAKGEN